MAEPVLPQSPVPGVGERKGRRVAKNGRSFVSLERDTHARTYASPYDGHRRSRKHVHIHGYSRIKATMLRTDYKYRSFTEGDERVIGSSRTVGFTFEVRPGESYR